MGSKMWQSLVDSSDFRKRDFVSKSQTAITPLPNPAAMCLLSGVLFHEMHLQMDGS
jgi:hypothetical protein